MVKSVRVVALTISMLSPALRTRLELPDTSIFPAGVPMPNPAVRSMMPVVVMSAVVLVTASKINPAVEARVTLPLPALMAPSARDRLPVVVVTVKPPLVAVADVMVVAVLSVS